MKNIINKSFKLMLAFFCVSIVVGFFSCKPKTEEPKIEKKEIAKAEPKKKVEENKQKGIITPEYTNPKLSEDLTDFGYTKKEFVKFKENLKFEKGAKEKPEAHKKYLQNELKFSELLTPKFDTEKTAVVGSFVCKFYPNAKIEKQEDLANLPEGIEIPFASILPIYGEPIEIEPEEEYGSTFFEFEENQNWFYHTKWNGQEGLVFGADLTGVDWSLQKNTILSLQYQDKGCSSKFYPVNGYYQLSTEIQQALEKQRIAFQTVTYDEYSLYIQKPDDMLSLYQKHCGYRSYYDRNPIFITTDLIAHTRHLVFDRTLQHIEENYFIPRLEKLIFAFLKELDTVNNSSSITADDKTLETAKLYFLTAKAILDLNPNETVEENEDGERILVSKELDIEKILSRYPEAVQKQVRLINEASESCKSPILFLKEDYTQYKPRGHYTKSKKLETYFKLMSWFGRSHFLISAENAEDFSYNMVPITLLITELVKNNKDLYAQWEDLFDPITDLIGISDDLSFKEVLPLWENYGVKDFKDWSSKKDNLIQFITESHKKLRSPAIAGSSVFYSPSDTDEKGMPIPPMGWRLFGQRYVFDSEILYHTSSPRLYGRQMVQGLDIIKTFGSKSANKYLQADYETFSELNNILNTMSENLQKDPETTFGKTYYGSVLNEIALQAQFDEGSGFYFTETPAWGIKSLLSSHGSLAELKHDTILYTKQNCAELGGGGDESPTFRTEPIPVPVHYIEPNLPFWKNALNSTLLLSHTLKAYKLTNEKIAEQLDYLIEICTNAIKIVELEIEDKPVDKKSLEWITSIPSSLASIVLIGINPHMDSIETKHLQMALVADIFTNAETQAVLEMAVGIPYRMFVALNDKQGGKRIAVGYCFNYYEFEQPSSNRLNDEQWKAQVYGETPIDENKKPEWAKNIALPANDDK